MSTNHGDARPTVQGLAGRLRALREATRPQVSQKAASDAIEVSQPKISRAETGRGVLLPDQVRKLCDLYGASRQERDQLFEWATALQPQTVRRGTLLRRHGGTAGYQKRVGDMEAAAAVVRAFQPSMVLGMLQTEAYAREVFGRHDPTGAAERVRRNHRLLRENTRRWLLVQPVGAYLWNLGGSAVMAEQMDAIVTASRLPHVDLRVITPQQQVDFFATHGFHIYDEMAVVIGILTGSTTSTNPDDIRPYLEQHAQLMAAGLVGDEARAAIAEVTEQYRSRPG